ncbi:class A beta-lactamase [Motilimonas sp. KMU-193]|uniref:class A beta-lactamase n=1 Tax=Motilimonas sp. KMU-193 TaxID=3388668 RepID=UPI00396B1FE8
MKKRMKTRLMLGVLLMGAFCGQAVASQDNLNQEIKAIEKRVNARIGMATFQPEIGRLWQYRGDERFPISSTFKTLVCARMLGQVESGGLDGKASTLIQADMLVPWSPVTEKNIGRSMTVMQACEATMLTSDNTAVNLVLAHLGGQPSVMRFIRLMGDMTTKLVSIEPEINDALPDGERDTTTPVAMVHTLNQIFTGPHISDQAKAQLKQWMMDNTVSDDLIRSVLPPNWQIADRTGAGSYGSRGITALLWQGEQPPTFVSIYLTNSELSLADRNKVIAELASLLFKYPETLVTPLN